MKPVVTGILETIETRGPEAKAPGVSQHDLQHHLLWTDA